MDTWAERGRKIVTRYGVVHRGEETQGWSLPALWSHLVFLFVFCQPKPWDPQDSCLMPHPSLMADSSACAFVGLSAPCCPGSGGPEIPFTPPNASPSCKPLRASDNACRMIPISPLPGLPAPLESVWFLKLWISNLVISLPAQVLHRWSHVIFLRH